MSDPPTAWQTEPIAETDSAVGFDCGKKELNRFFARHAYSNDRRGIGKTFILRRLPDRVDLPAVIGFYTLSMASLEAAELPASLGTLPKYPMPVALIGRLAVDVRAQRRGYADVLMADAFGRILAASEIVGCLGVVADAKDANAVEYYERLGFEAIEPPEKYPRRMFLPLATLLGAR